MGAFFEQVIARLAKSVHQSAHQIEQSYIQSKSETSNRQHIWHTVGYAMVAIVWFAGLFSAYNEAAPFLYPHIQIWIIAVFIIWVGLGLWLKYCPMRVISSDKPTKPRLVSGMVFYQHSMFGAIVIFLLWIDISYHPPVQLGTIAGRICYDGTGPFAPVPDVIVQVLGTSQQTITNQDGYFQITDVSPSHSMVTAFYLGEHYRLLLNPNGNGDYPIIPESSRSSDLPTSFLPSDWHEEMKVEAAVVRQIGQARPSGSRPIKQAQKAKTMWFHLEKTFVPPPSFKALHVEISCHNGIKILEINDFDLKPDGWLTIVDNGRLNNTTRQWEYDGGAGKSPEHLTFSVWLHTNVSSEKSSSMKSDLQGDYSFEVPINEQ